MSLTTILDNYNAIKSTPEELYTTLFHIGDGYIQKRGEYRSKDSKDFKGNPIVYVNDKENYKGKMRRYIMFEDTFEEQLKEALQSPSNLLNPISYYGRRKNKEYSDRCFGLIFDIDDIDEVTLNRFLYGCYSKYDIYPLPNYLVISKSGKGMHLYYIFDEPIRLYPKIKIKLKELKYDMTTWLWNGYTSNNEKPQYQSYHQSFMVAGTSENMSIWKLQNELYSVEELFSLVDIEFDKNELWPENKYTLEEAKEKFPQWYQKVIVENGTADGTWECKRDLYDWWIRKILDPNKGAVFGHRYWCLMMLVIYGVKCGIPFEEVKADAYKLMPLLNDRKPDNPFTEDDVESALECYDIQFATFPIKDISKLSGIEIKKNKRNGLKQNQHLYLARRRKEDMKAINLPMKAPEGRPKGSKDKSPRKNKSDIVKEWRKNNPNGSKKDCKEETGLTYPTIRKWWGND